MFNSIKNLITWLKIGKVISETTDSIQKEAKNMEAKSILRSKTFWFNLITGLVTVGGVIQGSPLAANPHVQVGVGLFISIGNIILRAITNQPITLPGDKV